MLFKNRKIPLASGEATSGFKRKSYPQWMHSKKFFEWEKEDDKQQIIPTYLEEILSSVRAHLEQINLFEIVGLNQEQGKM